MIAEPVDTEQIEMIMQAVGLVVSFDSERFLALDVDQQARVRCAVERYYAVVGQPDEAEGARRPSSLVGALMPHRPGRKSALFRRLLAGREPFPVPPPTSYSYPWYDLLDSPGPRSVSIGGCGTLATAIRSAALFDGSAGQPEVLMVNQDLWIVVRANDAARACLSAADAADADSPVALAAAKDAEWVIRHPGAPEHRIYWGTDGVLNEGHVSDLPPSIRMGEFEVIRVIRSREEDMRLQCEERQAALAAPIESGPLSVATALAARALNELAREDWKPFDRGPLVQFRRWGWVIAPISA